MIWEGYVIIMLALIAVGALLWDVRRGNIEPAAFLAAIQGFACGGIFAVLLPFLDRQLAGLSPSTQASVRSHGHLVVFLYYFLICAAVMSCGWAGFWQAFTAFYEARKPVGVFRRLIPFIDDYWAVVEHARELSFYARILIFAHHAAFAIAVLIIGGSGLFMTFGFPISPAWLYLAAGIAAAFVLNPARSDRRRAARMAASEQLIPTA